MSNAEPPSPPPATRSWPAPAPGPVPPPPPSPPAAANEGWVRAAQKKTDARHTWIAGAVLVAIVGGLVWLGAAFGGNDTGSQRTWTNPVVAGVLSEIAAETDCGSLQASFDRGDASSERGYRLDGVNVGLLYMKAADSRMRQIGCYR